MVTHHACSSESRRHLRRTFSVLLSFSIFVRVIGNLMHEDGYTSFKPTHSEPTQFWRVAEYEVKHTGPRVFQDTDGSSSERDLLVLLSKDGGSALKQGVRRLSATWVFRLIINKVSRMQKTHITFFFNLKTIMGEGSAYLSTNVHRDKKRGLELQHLPWVLETQMLCKCRTHS